MNILKKSVLILLLIFITLSCQNQLAPEEQKDKASCVIFSKGNCDLDYLDKISVTLSCNTLGTDFYYTLDGTEPDINNPSQRYKAPIDITIKTDITIKAVAVKANMEPSDITSVTYKLKTYNIKYETNSGIKIEPITGLKKGDVITQEQLPTLQREYFYFLGWYLDKKQIIPDEYTITSDVTLIANWNEYEKVKIITNWPYIDKPILDSDGACIIYKGYYHLFYTDPEGCTIYYTTDGTTPSETSEVYQGNLHITDDTIIKAIAKKDGMYDSEIITGKFKIYRGTVTFEGTDFCVAPSPIENVKDGTYLDLPILKADGYIFKGWKRFPESNESFFKYGISYGNTKDPFHFYPVWEKVNP